MKEQSLIKRFRSTQLLAMALALAMFGLILLPAVAFTDDREDDDERGDGVIVRVPGDAPTIQEAINMVPDGGTVRIAPGTYRETVDIVGKRVNLVGDGREGSRRALIIGAMPRGFVPVDETRGLINFGPGGGGRLSNLTLLGGDVGVRGQSDDRRGRPNRVMVADVALMQNGRGVAGTFSQLTVSHSSITGSLIHGFSLPCFDGLELTGIYLANSGQVGVFASSCIATANVVIDNSVISNHPNCGAILVGDLNVDITDSLFSANSKAGVLLLGVPDTTILNTTIEGTTEGAPTWFSGLATGVAAGNCGIVRLLFSQSIGNVQAGVILVGSTEGRFVFTDVTANRWGVVTQNGALYVDLGGNNVTGNTEQDFLTDGNLPVPEPPDVPQP